jgi:hypothetical protein
MKTIVKLTNQDGQEFYYSTINANDDWKIPITTPNALSLAKVVETTSDELFYLDFMANLNDYEMEIIPTQKTIGTYLSTYKYKGLFYEKVIPIYLILLPFIILALLSYIGWLR